MNKDHLNLEIRKFLKRVGITSQRAIKTHIKKLETENENK